MTPRKAVALVGTPTGKSIALLILGAMALTVASVIVVRGGLARSAEAAATYLAEDVKALRQEARALAALKKAGEDAAPLTSVPAFIDRIGDLANQHDAVVGAVRPAEEDDAQFEIELSAGYRELLQFIAALEELDIQVDGFALKRTALEAGPPKLAAVVSIRPRNDARRLAIPRLAAVRTALNQSQTRDPFQALVADGVDGGGDRLDLTQAYKLTGIAVIEPAGEHIATIDLFDYVVGDILDGRRVVAVARDRVLLDAQDEANSQKFIIRFRDAEAHAEIGASLNIDPLFRGSTIDGRSE